MFAALNTVEPPILERETAKLLEGDKTWYEERLPLVEDRVRNPLDQLSGRLSDADWLDGAFRARPDDGVGAAQVEIIVDFESTFPVPTLLGCSANTAAAAAPSL